MSLCTKGLSLNDGSYLCLCLIVCLLSCDTYNYTQSNVKCYSAMPAPELHTAAPEMPQPEYIKGLPCIDDII